VCHNCQEEEGRPRGRTVRTASFGGPKKSLRPCLMLAGGKV